MSDSDLVSVLLFCEPPELGEWYAEDVGAFAEEAGLTATLFSTRFQFTVRSGDPEEILDFDEVLDRADIVVGLIRFVDVLTLERVERLVSSIPPGLNKPMGFLLYREDGETDFKMSCPFCGQKLWVRDADVDKRGRCPNCKKGFTLPMQEDHLSTQLMLRDAIQVKKVFRGNPSSVGAPLKALLNLLKGGMAQGGRPRAKELNSQTVRVEVNPDKM